MTCETAQQFFKAGLWLERVKLGSIEGARIFEAMSRAFFGSWLGLARRLPSPGWPAFREGAEDLTTIRPDWCLLQTKSPNIEANRIPVAIIRLFIQRPHRVPSEYPSPLERLRRHYSLGYECHQNRFGFGAQTPRRRFRCACKEPPPQSDTGCPSTQEWPRQPHHSAAGESSSPRLRSITPAPRLLQLLGPARL
jgi:hypothetical protein